MYQCQRIDKHKSVLHHLGADYEELRTQSQCKTHKLTVWNKSFTQGCTTLQWVISAHPVFFSPTLLSLFMKHKRGTTKGTGKWKGFGEEGRQSSSNASDKGTK
jgi:hypothetical protein